MHKCVCVFVMAALSASAAQGTVAFGDVTLGSAGPMGLDLGVFVTCGTMFSASNSGTTFNTNIGLGPGASTNVSGGGMATGNLYKDPTATLQANFNSQFNIGGSIITQDLTQAVADVQNAATLAAMLAPDQTFGAVGGAALTISPSGALNGMGGRNTVVDIDSISISNPSKDLTISGGVNDFYIINVGTGVNGTVLDVTNGAILLSGGITPNHVLFNIIATGDVVLTNASSTLNGTFLAPFMNQSINLTPGTVNGGIIGCTIHTSSGPIVNGSLYTGVPTPGAGTLLALGGVVALRRRRR